MYQTTTVCCSAWWNYAGMFQSQEPEVKHWEQYKYKQMSSSGIVSQVHINDMGLPHNQRCKVDQTQASVVPVCAAVACHVLGKPRLTCQLQCRDCPPC